MSIYFCARGDATAGILTTVGYTIVVADHKRVRPGKPLAWVRGSLIQVLSPGKYKIYSTEPEDRAPVKGKPAPVQDVDYVIRREPYRSVSNLVHVGDITVTAE